MKPEKEKSEEELREEYERDVELWLTIPSDIRFLYLPRNIGKYIKDPIEVINY